MPVKNKSIYFRVFLNHQSGLGHFTRSRILAENLKKKGYDVTIITDLKPEFSIKTNVKLVNLYANKHKIDQIKDARKFLKKSINKPGYVCLDHYKLKQKWIEEVKKKHIGIFYFHDFLDKVDNVDIIINSKPDFLNPYYKTAYNKLNKNSKNLLGPKYCIINKKFIKNRRNKNYFDITFNFGALNCFKEVQTFTQFVKKLYPELYKVLSIKLLIKPQLKKFKIRQMKKLKDNKIKFLGYDQNIFKKINNTHLYIGSAGITIFETAMYRIPSIFFILARNQIIKFGTFTNLGHLFLLEKKDLKRSRKLANLIFLIYQNYSKILEHYNNTVKKVDDYGVNRIAEFIENYIKKNAQKN